MSGLRTPNYTAIFVSWQGRWDEAIDAYNRAAEAPYPYAPPDYDPFTVHGQDAMTTRASEVDAKMANCLCRLKDQTRAAIRSDESKTRAILNALRWEDLASRIPDAIKRTRLVAVLAEVRALEAESRVALEPFGAKPDTETEWRLIGARGRLREIARSHPESEALDAFALTENDVIAAIPSDCALILPVITPFGSAFIAFSNGGERGPEASATFTVLTTQDCRKLLDQYVQVLDALAHPRSQDPVALLDRLLDDLSTGLARDIRSAAKAIGVSEGAPLRVVSQLGIGALPLHAAVDRETKRTLQEDFVYSTIPSIGVVAYHREREREAAVARQTVVVANPTGDLPYAALGASLVHRRVPAGESRLIPGRAATRSEIMAATASSNLHNTSKDVAGRLRVNTWTPGFLERRRVAPLSIG